jgi:RNA polymerase sigma factor (sigma-70 family)
VTLLGDDPARAVFQTWKMGAAPQLAEDLFHEHHRRIYFYCLRQLGSPEEAEDAVQVTYLNACRSLKDGFEPDAAQAWLFKVAHNVCLTRQRSSYRRARLERPEDLQAVQDVVAAPEAPGDELFGLDEALAGLPEQQRQAILLREWQGLSYREVAAKLGLTQAAVETLIFRARRSLASALEKPVKRRGRLMHSLDAGALLASLKSVVAGNVAASVATAIAVAASATAITVAASPSKSDFPRRITPTAKVEKAVPAAPRANLADHSSPEAVYSPSALPSPTGHPRKEPTAHPRANGKGKPKHENNGHKNGKKGSPPKGSKAHPPKGSNAHPPKGSKADPPTGSNADPSSTPPGQVVFGSHGKSSSTPAYGQDGSAAAHGKSAKNG